MRITNKYNLPQSSVSFAESDYQYTPNRYSVSTLMNGATETILKYRHNDEIEKDVSELIWAIFGQATHKVLEEQEVNKHETKETKIDCEIDGSIISGIYDLYNDKTKTIVDYKTTSVWKVINKDFKDYYMRGLIYSYILKQKEIDVKKAEFVLLLKDHSKTKANTEKDYPKLPVFVYKFDITNKELDFIEKFIKDKLKQIKALEIIEDNLLPPCSEEERWYTGTKYAVVKKGNIKAIKLYESKDLAEKHASESKDFYIEERIGKDGKCEEYCDVKEFCPYYKNKIKNDGSGKLPF